MTHPKCMANSWTNFSLGPEVRLLGFKCYFSTSWLRDLSLPLLIYKTGLL